MEITPLENEAMKYIAKVCMNKGDGTKKPIDEWFALCLKLLTTRGLMSESGEDCWSLTDEGRKYIDERY